MKQSRKTSIALSEDELGILDAIASRLNLSRTEVVRHLILYQGLCGGDFPLTRKIINLPAEDRQRIVAQIRAKAELGEPAKPQAFQQWIKDALGASDPLTQERAADTLLRKLLGS